MDLRRWIIYSCCVIAGMVMLAHSFVPHFHQNGIIYFSLNQACNASTCDHNNDHRHGPYEDCKLKDLSVRPEVNENITPSLSDRFLLTFHLLFQYPEQIIPQKDYAETDRQHKPYLLLYTSAIANSVSGLRAPPVSFRN